MFPWFQNSLKFSGKVGSRFITIDCRIWPDWSASMAIPLARSLASTDSDREMYSTYSEAKLRQRLALWAVVLVLHTCWMDRSRLVPCGAKQIFIKEASRKKINLDGTPSPP